MWMALGAYTRKRLRRLAKIPPPGLLALLYASLVAIGSVLLKTPIATTQGLDWSEAIFTSTSAVTVTGLGVVDTGQAFTLFGQAVIMVLIQLGGLGLMTFAALLLSALGIPIGLSQRLVLQEDLGQTSIADLIKLVRRVIVIAAVFEGVGAAILCVVFVPDLGWAEGIWNAVFHSVSAFNNAGFALRADSLSAWVGNPIINLVVPILFIAGGLGFVVLGDLLRKPGWRAYSLHTKLMIVGTVMLIGGPFVLITLLEWSNPGTLGALAGMGEKLQAAWFQTVTPRTAGFNTLDTAALHDTTALLIIALMLIGGGSASTAGGVKVTSFIVLLMATFAFFKKRQGLVVFGRSLGMREVMKVMALTTLSMVSVFVALFVISITNDGDFLDLAFEVASAFGTVGLSRGLTGELDLIGQITIMAMMFIGRVGPLTLGFFLGTKAAPRVEYPEGQVHLG